ncbi:uncharacterized protein AMSG_02382 [Thecamonas trahens ATCC 50062]|uniref:Uncharacterized protein n=1 Tax=Thecamonas trahens ATCC 50062 TaxID=461836 RepID=A0A0L0DWF2_THETB|nr:hypothetical protein AMSG_02382 [Thecamonas trahens ATCC 50062]KNC56411.1 hypothetical protein AMSG_02382 [Thecamonas trahens ATCC 50062]|eukprot:XP_013760924.1 hypothetical protein AMSG_02382 [Thecamonas trahens ATCC 50062]
MLATYGTTTTEDPRVTTALPFDRYARDSIASRAYAGSPAVRAADRARRQRVADAAGQLPTSASTRRPTGVSLGPEAAAESVRSESRGGIARSVMRSQYYGTDPLSQLGGSGGARWARDSIAAQPVPVLGSGASEVGAARRRTLEQYYGTHTTEMREHEQL